MKLILVDAIDCFVVPGVGIFEEMHDLLETYPNPKLLLSGADDEGFERFGLAATPYEVFTLKHDPEKSDPRYYEILLEHLNRSAGEVVYFEHNPKAVESARSVGIETFAYDPEAKDLPALKEFLDRTLG